MLGEKVGEFQGKVIGQRVLPSDGQGPRMETSVQFGGTLLGIEANTSVTYTSVLRPDGHLYGEGNGIVMTADGEGATFVGQGVGTFTGRGAGISFRGATYYQTTAKSLESLNSFATLFEYEVEEDGETVSGTLWEWK